MLVLWINIYIKTEVSNIKDLLWETNVIGHVVKLFSNQTLSSMYYFSSVFLFLYSLFSLCPFWTCTWKSMIVNWLYKKFHLWLKNFNFKILNCFVSDKYFFHSINYVYLSKYIILSNKMANIFWQFLTKDRKSVSSGANTHVLTCKHMYSLP